MREPVYLDYNATAPARPEVIAAVTEAMALPGNPSSVHTAGRQARRAVEDARAQVARMVGTIAPNVVFTSGATEANNIALRGWDRPMRVLTSSVEHPSVIEALEAERIPVTSTGLLDLDALRALLEKPNDRQALVSVMLVNNETGVIQPMAEIIALAREYDAVLHCDAVQAAGKLPLDFDESGLDLLSLSGHKIGGPKGIGALVVNPKHHIRSLIHGGGQEKGRRSGTENVAGCVGFGVAAEIALEEIEEQSRYKDLRDRLEAAVSKALPQVVVIGDGAERVGTVTCLALPGVGSETQVMAMDLAGIAISAGSACSSGKVKRSQVVSAMGYGDEIAGSSIRVSLGWATTEADIDRFVEAYVAFAGRQVAATG